VIDTDAGTVEHVENPNERPLATVSVAASGMSSGELVDAVERAAKGTPGGRRRARVPQRGRSRPRTGRVALEQFQEAVPGALWVQDRAADGEPRRSRCRVGRLSARSSRSGWRTSRCRTSRASNATAVVTLGARFLEDARGETV
jgi:hypothetical protein